MIKQKLLLLIIFVFTSPFSFAQVSDDSINKLMDLSGLTIQIGQFPELVKVGMEQAKQHGTQIPEVEYNAILLSIEKSLLPTEILAEIRGELKKSISESQANEMLVWYESDLGKKITLAEEIIW